VLSLSLGYGLIEDSKAKSNAENRILSVRISILLIDLR
jgi:hypothetical protein